MGAGQTPDRRRCSRCSSSVCGVHTLSRSDTRGPRRPAPAASGAAEDSGRSSGAAPTETGLDTHSPVAVDR